MSVRCRCGAALLDDLTTEGVTPVGGEPMTFRRLTDYVACSECHSVYKIAPLQEGQTLEDAVLGVQEEGESLVETLERLLETGHDAH